MSDPRFCRRCGWKLKTRGGHFSERRGKYHRYKVCTNPKCGGTETSQESPSQHVEK